MFLRPSPGRSGPPPPPPTPTPKPRPRGGAVALGLGVLGAGLFGLVLIRGSDELFALAPSRDAPSGPPLSVVVEPDEPPLPIPPDPEGGRLDTFTAPPPDSDRPVPVRRMVPPATPPSPQPRPVRASRPPSEPRGASFRPSFDCRHARSRAEHMVCDDPRLAAADRALHHAFEAAMRRAPDPRALRAEQDRWLVARERAAPDPAAVAAVYHLRIDELEAAF